MNRGFDPPGATGKAASVLIIGSGVAGCSMAAMIDHDRFDVTLVDRATFPRKKICGGCIGPPGLRCLKQLGVIDPVRQSSLPTNRWAGYFGPRTVQVDLPEGIAVCRSRLDPILRSAARDRGSTIMEGCSAKLRSAGDDRHAAVVDLNGVRREFDLVVAASGLAGLNLTGTLPWVRVPESPIGVSLHVAGRVEPGVIHMIVDRSGYVGLVQLPGGVVDVAGALWIADKSPVRTMTRMIDNSPIELTVAPERLTGGPWTTPPLRRQRLAAAGRVIAIGDAHRYVEPFTGEGMTWAMQSGIFAAETLGRVGAEALPDCYRRSADKVAKTHRRRCRMLTSAIRRPWVQTLAGQALSAMPMLATPIVQHLAADGNQNGSSGADGGRRNDAALG